MGVRKVFVVKACTEFSAAHRIEGHRRCSRVHGHNYRVCVWVKEEEPMEIDLDELERWLHYNVYEKFDHQYLNTILHNNLGEASRVTSEDIARLIAEQLRENYPERVLRVEVCETRNLCVEYVPSG